MTFYELIAAVLRLLKSHPEVAFERGEPDPTDGTHIAYQYRISRISEWPRTSLMVRGWLGGQWSSWRQIKGWLGGPAFDLADVAATEWRITAPAPGDEL